MGQRRTTKIFECFEDWGIRKQSAIVCKKGHYKLGKDRKKDGSCLVCVREKR